MAAKRGEQDTGVGSRLRRAAAGVASKAAAATRSAAAVATSGASDKAAATGPETVADTAAGSSDGGQPVTSTTAKTATRKSAAKKPAAKKAPAKKAPAKKAAAKKAAVTQAPETAPPDAGPPDAAAAAAASSEPAAEVPAAREPAKKSSATRAAGKKAAAAKAPAAKAPARKAATKAPAATQPAAGGAAQLVVREDEAPWTKAELDEIREALLEDIARLREEIAMTEADIADLIRDSGEGAGDDQADAGSKTFEREHEMSLANNAREMLLQAERALHRIDVGTYGVCESCGKPIGKLRLQAFPRATMCLACKQQEERH